MKAATASEQTSATMDARGNKKRIEQARAEALDLLARKNQNVEEIQQKLHRLEVESVYRGVPDAERTETLRVLLIEQRGEIETLKAKIEHIEEALEQAAEDIRKSDRSARVQAAQRLLERYRSNVSELQNVLLQAEKINDRITELDAELRRTHLDEVGGKPLVLLARSGGAWNSLCPIPIPGGIPIHVSEWLAHVERILGE